MSTGPTVPILPPNMSGPLTYVYANDEDIAVRAGGDFILLSPRWQKLAYGTDGTIPGINSWQLTSLSATFDAAGVGPGNVVLLTQPKTRFRGSGELFGVSTLLDPTDLLLRRIGPTSPGLPPGTFGTDLPGVEYTILTLLPQIEQASYWINQTYNILPGVPGREPETAYDLRDIRDLTVLTVIVRRLVAEVQDTPNAAWNVKLLHYQAELSAVQSRVQIRWVAPGEVPPPSTWFSTRIGR
jgi:hypothetical protein